MLEATSSIIEKVNIFMIRFVLDPDGNAPIESGYHLVDDDISLLRGISEQQPLFIRGERLCRWAAQIAEVRGLESIWRKAPQQELLEDCPGLSLSEAKNIFSRLGKSADSLSRPIKTDDVVKMLWPSDILWGSRQSTPHAFAWLLWCMQQVLLSEDVVLLKVIREKWLINSAGVIYEAYNTIKAEDAYGVLQKWLGLKKSSQEWPAIPVELPKELLGKLTAEWRSQLIRTDGQFLQEMQELNLAREISESLARVALEYYQRNPSYLSLSCAEALYPYLNIQELDKLYNLLPPDDPGYPPNNYKDIVQWFKNKYLPYRLNSSHCNSDRVRDIAQKFAIWFLEFYAQSRAGGEGAEYLSWCKTARLENTSEVVSLVVVLDGLSLRDGELFTKYLQDKSRRLEMDEFEVVISPLPTVTCMAKPALITGFNPSCALDEDRLGTVERRALDVISAMNNANNGDIVIWSILEPDHTYHQSSDPDSIRSDVDGWMQGFAARLSDVVNQVCDSKNVRLIITTDHGRLLSSAQRLHQVPSGMEAHGRAAWGTADIHFGESGYFIDGNVVYLHPGRFGTPKTCAVLMNDDAFVMSDGRGGRESFPHGGLFPEEVLIPWIQFSRDRGTIIIEANLTGKGIAKSSGTYSLEILNTSAVRINILSIEIPQMDYRAPLRFEVGAMAKKVTDISVTYWPTNSESNYLEANILYSLPTGERKTLTIKPSLLIEEMYQQEDILSDL